MDTLEPRRSDVLEGVSQEVLNLQEQKAVRDDLECGATDFAEDKILRGLDMCVVDRKIDPERARTLYVLLGFGSSRLEWAQGFEWN